MTCPQCPQIKLSPPVPDIRLSVRRIERLSVVTEPTGIMGMVAILFPPDVMVFEKPRPKTEPDQHAFLACHIFALAGVVRVQKIAALRDHVMRRERSHISVMWNIPWMRRVSYFDLRMMDGSV